VKWSELQSIKDIQIFLEFANFYRHFIKKYSQIVRALNAHLATKPIKGMIHWQFLRNRKSSEQAKKVFVLSLKASLTFKNLKEAFITASILRHFDQKRPSRVKTDASEAAISAILTQCESMKRPDQHWHSVAYWSQKMKPAELNYETPNQKLLTIVKAFAHWQHYLEEAFFSVLVLTNHKNLQTFLTIKKLSRRQVRWAEKMSVYNLQIVYRSGAKNPADGPSQRLNYAVTVKNENVNKEDLDFSLVKLKEQLQPH